MAVSPFAIRGLYAITPDIDDTTRLLACATKALDGGARLIQYRNKAVDAATAFAQASALRNLTSQYQATYIVNDSAELALAVHADGVHLGRRDGASMDIQHIRRESAGRGLDNFMIGISCYNEAGVAAQAAVAGADYLAFGSFFPSRVKPDAVHADISLIRQAKERHRLPVVAIGGITLQNAPQLIGAGADAIAVISALFESHDIESTARSFTALFNSHVQHRQ